VELKAAKTKMRTLLIIDQEAFAVGIYSRGAAKRLFGRPFCRMSRVRKSGFSVALFLAASLVAPGLNSPAQSSNSPPAIQLLEADTNLRLSVAGSSGNTYGILASTDLVNWTPLCVSSDPMGQFGTVDGQFPFHSQRFYRAASGIACPPAGLTQQIRVLPASLEFYQGSTGSFTVQLAMQPGNTVLVQISLNAGSSNIVVNNASLSFTPANWNIPQTVTVSATGSNTNGTQFDAYFVVTSGAIAAQGVRVIALNDTMDDEFVGPFASWANAKSDFGAAGDGIADDTTALQNALNALRSYTGKPALYLPAGTYRITQTLNVSRSVDSESKDLLITGQDPASTRIVWGGVTNGLMINYQAWYAKMGRLTLDGAGLAHTAIAHGSAFSTHNEFSDMAFENLAFGIEAGTSNGLGNAETVVQRCVFTNCSQAGVSVQNYDSLNWFVWDCQFDDCGSGLSNEYGAGNFHVYRSLFRNSTQADISIANTSYFSIRNNLSIGSQAFVTAAPIDSCSPITLEGNTVLAPTGVPIQIGNLGPVSLIDNNIDAYQGLAADLEPSGSLVTVGNTFTVTNAIQGTPARISLDDVTTCEPLPAFFPRQPRALPNLGRPLIDVVGPTNAAGVQAAINVAATLSGQRPVVHLSAGVYLIGQTITIPAGCDVQLVGDGGKTGLRWAGTGTGPILRLAGPSRATVRDMALFGTFNSVQADAILIDNCDQPGARIYLSQSDVSSTVTGLFVEGITNAGVDLENFYHAQNQMSVLVQGSGQVASGQKLPAETAIFGGASAGNNLTYQVTNGGSLLVRDMWYESANTNQPRFMKCTGSGSFTLQGANVAPSYSQSSIPTVEITNFAGNLNFLSTQFLFPNTSLSVAGNGQNTSVLMLGTVNSNDPSFNSPQAQVGLFQSFDIQPDGGFNLIYSLNTSYPNFPRDFLRNMLRLTRNATPPDLTPVQAGVSDVRLRRVFVESGGTGVHIKH
jgi:hypothetical protein